MGTHVDGHLYTTVCSGAVQPSTVPHQCGQGEALALAIQIARHHQ